MTDPDIAAVRHALELQTKYYEAIDLPSLPQEEIQALASLARLEARLERWPIVVTGFTGVLACDFAAYHEDVEKVLGHPVYTHEFGMPDMQEKIKEAYRGEFRALAGKDAA